MDFKKTNFIIKKLSTVYIKSVKIILKKNISAMSKTRKVFVKARLLPKLLVKRLAKVLIKEVVESGIIRASISGYIIRLL